MSKTPNQGEHTTDPDHPTDHPGLVGAVGRVYGAAAGSAGAVSERVGERRARLLVELADAVRELTEASVVTEYVEERVDGDELVTRRGRRRKTKSRVRVRRAHHKRLPSLLDQLRYAEPPAGVDPGARGAWTKGFESKPPAELATLSVLGEIVDGSALLAKALGVTGDGGVERRLARLVSADMRPDDLTEVAREVTTWVRRAKHALRVDAMPITLGDPCPYCWRKNCLVIAGDLASARCTRCGRSWTQDTIGLLASMLQANQYETAAQAAETTSGRCWMRDCIRTGDHNQHADHRGRTWGDTCAVEP